MRSRSTYTRHRYLDQDLTFKRYEDLVVQDNFRFGDDKEIVVALQDNVLSLNKKQLRKPTRTSLAPQTDRRRSRGGDVGGGSGIVKEYR
jgi:hypothetical protein